MCDGAIDDAGNFVLLGNIRRQDETGVSHLAGRCFQPFFAAPDQGNPSPFPCQGKSAGTSDTAACTRNDGNLAF